jgi:pimeloyl-ACP methyl ester carboxylesterase
MSMVYNPTVEPLPAFRGERITILDSSDKEIRALLLEKKNSKKVLIFCHESGMTKETWEKYAYFFPDRGFSVLSIDYKSDEDPENENSLIQWPKEEDVERLVTAIRWAKKAFGPNAEIILFGVSNGADVAFAASFYDENVKAVITDGIFSMKEIFRDYIRRWAPVLVKPNLFGQNYPNWVVNLFTNLGFWYSQKKSNTRFVDVEKLLKRKHVPHLMIHGGQDDYVTESHQNFLENLNRDQSLVRFFVSEAKHNEAVTYDRKLYERAVMEFLSKI